ncbi:5-guanidino-2-oxopentanoate decarboxylase [Pseudoteredinibacter isoporae]|uniref:5-guanidino-2-oxopentanoate decarboxylase n=1 Tax=Pseudoteredinibacter isoporae TaxID=570281 RepID=UPI003109FE92
MNTAAQTGGVLLARLMEAYGIDTAFGIPGTHTIELYRGLPQTNIRHVTPRHEQGAGFMADGYARVSGRPAACVTVSGPGALNIATAMGQALQDSVPMLVISADNNRHEKGLGEGRLHETADLQRAMEQSSVWAHTVSRVDELPMILARAFAIFHSQRPGPVHLSMPLDVITADASHVAVETWPLPSRPGADNNAIQAAADLLSQAKNPVLALGGGAADAGALAVALAEKLDAPTTVTHNAKGILPPEHPLLINSSPSYQAVRDLYLNADVILGIGTEFGETDYDFFFDGGFKLGGKLIRIDIDSTQLCRNARPDIAIQSDSAAAITALLPKLEFTARSGAQRSLAIREKLAPSVDADYQRFLDALLEALPEAAILGDSTQPTYFAAAQLQTRKTRRFASAATGYGTLGYALPAAFGAKLAKPELPIISLIGDGGLQFTINELSTAVEAQLPVAIVVWNNQRYEMIAQNFNTAGMEPIACDIHTPDFLGIAKAYGCRAVRAENIQQLIQQLREHTEHALPTVIEVREADFLTPVS